MLAQRVCGLALGYEDLNDHDRLRHNPLMNVTTGQREPDRPLYIFCGDPLLAVRLREANQGANAGSLAEIQRIVARLRKRWPEGKLLLRAGAGFRREELVVG